LQDRYGALPEPVEKLMELMEIRVLCQKLHISRVKLKGHQAHLTIEPETPVTPQTIASLTDKRLKFLSEYQLSVTIDRKGWKQDIKTVKHTLKSLLGSNRAE
jgi:transcription-repair coupling factor (superfamily II helicase)